MNKQWEKHIQPIIDRHEWHHFSWVWDPFINEYKKLALSKRRSIDKALADCAFDPSSDELSIKALGIASTLHSAGISSRWLSITIRRGLKEQLANFTIENNKSRYYVSACVTYSLKETIPDIESIIESLEAGLSNNNLEKAKDSYFSLLNTCYRALSELNG
jgi:hypothetical protein